MREAEETGTSDCWRPYPVNLRNILCVASLVVAALRVPLAKSLHLAGMALWDMALADRLPG